MVQHMKIKDRYISMEHNRELRALKYSQVSFDKGAKPIQCGKNVFFNK